MWKRNNVLLLPAHCTYGPLSFIFYFFYKSILSNWTHSSEEPSAVSWPLARVRFLLSFLWIQFCLIVIYYLYIFYVHVPPYPIGLLILCSSQLFYYLYFLLVPILKFQKKKKKFFEISDSHY